VEGSARAKGSGALAEAHPALRTAATAG
jgi:hypothetical protein